MPAQGRRIARAGRHCIHRSIASLSADSRTVLRFNALVILLHQHTMQHWYRAPFEVSTDKARLDVAMIHAVLAQTYWSPGIPRQLVEKGIQGSMCFGAYEGSAQIGFARVISDQASFAYLCDVFVVEDARGRGVSKFMMECIKSHPELQNLRRWMLATADAHGLYSQFGFGPIAKPERMMEIVEPRVYQRLAAEGLSTGFGL